VVLHRIPAFAYLLVALTEKWPHIYLRLSTLQNSATRPNQLIDVKFNADSFVARFV
jgi:hypothetical protein